MLSIVCRFWHAHVSSMASHPELALQCTRALKLVIVSADIEKAEEAKALFTEMHSLFPAILNNSSSIEVIVIIGCIGRFHCFLCSCHRSAAVDRALRVDSRHPSQTTALFPVLYPALSGYISAGQNNITFIIVLLLSTTSKRESDACSGA